VAGGALFFASVAIHELAHSVVAKAFGIPVKGITLFLFGGVAQITREATRPLAEFIMAIAGPLMSVALASLFFLLWWLSDLRSNNSTTVMWELLWLMNIGVAVFNMAPGLPTDGGRVLRSVLWGVTGDYSRSTFIASWSGRLLAYGMIALGLVTAFGAVPFLSPMSGLWLMLIAFFLEGAARESWRQLKLLDFLRRYHAADIMSTQPATAPNWMTLRQAIPQSMDPQRVYLLVADGASVLGVLSAKELQAVRPEAWSTTTVAQAMLPAERARTVAPDADLASVLQTMQGEDLRCAPVVDGGRLVGVVTGDAIVRLLGSGQALV
jgi:Zn-dependent protease